MYDVQKHISHFSKINSNFECPKKVTQKKHNKNSDLDNNKKVLANPKMAKI